MEILIRRARPADVLAIAALVDAHARRGELLPRSRRAIRESLDTWIVATLSQRVLACGSLYPYSPTLTEIRSLAVEDGHKGEGLGTAVLEALIAEARRRGVHTLFALTRVVPFFERAGFQQSHTARFPEKVWRDCALCPLREDCDEQAVVLHLSRAADPSPARPSPAEKGVHHAR